MKQNVENQQVMMSQVLHPIFVDATNLASQFVVMSQVLHPHLWWCHKSWHPHLWWCHKSCIPIFDDVTSLAFIFLMMSHVLLPIFLYDVTSLTTSIFFRTLALVWWASVHVPPCMCPRNVGALCLDGFATLHFIYIIYNFNFWDGML